MRISRRYFMASLGAVASASSLPLKSLADTEAMKIEKASLAGMTFPHTAQGSQGIRFGYAAITWNGNDEQAMQEIAEVGFRGIQLRSNILKDYGERPKALHDLLAQHRLEFVALSSGGVGIAPGTETDEIAKHLRNAKFAQAAGCHYLQVTDSARPKDRKPESADFKQLGRLLSEIGKRSKDLGVPVGYHNHMGSLGESPDEVDRIMEAADPRYVKLELDVAHYQQGGGDPAMAIKKYRDRLLFLHIKDVETIETSNQGGRRYRFVELGRGRVDLPAVFGALQDVRFSGWAVVELDGVPDKSSTPKECAKTNRKYLEEKLRMKI